MATVAFSKLSQAQRTILKAMAAPEPAVLSQTAAMGAELRYPNGRSDSVLPATIKKLVQTEWLAIDTSREKETPRYPSDYHRTFYMLTTREDVK